MDFIKEAINDAGEKAANEVMVDQAAGAIKNVLGNDNSQLVDQVSSFAKKTLNNQSSGNSTQQTTETTQSSFLDQASNMIKQTVQHQSTTETTQNQNGEQQQQTTEKTTVKTDYVDKGISMIEEKVFNITADKQNKEQNEKIAGYVRAGIERISGHDSNNSNNNQNNNNNDNNGQQ